MFFIARVICCLIISLFIQVIGEKRGIPYIFIYVGVCENNDQVSESIDLVLYGS